MSSAVLSSALNHRSESSTFITEAASLDNKPFGNSPFDGCAHPSCSSILSTLPTQPNTPQQLLLDNPNNQCWKHKPISLQQNLSASLQTFEGWSFSSRQQRNHDWQQFLRSSNLIKKQNLLKYTKFATIQGFDYKNKHKHIEHNNFRVPTNYQTNPQKYKLPRFSKNPIPINQNGKKLLFCNTTRV